MTEKLYGLIGFPLSHSFSQKYFRNKFEKENIFNADYLNFEIENINKLPEIIYNHKNLYGFNVTIPYKIEILNFLDEIDITAKEIGAVNTVKIFRNESVVKLKGYNTDVYGFNESLKNKLLNHHKNALVLGTGGVSKAIVFALKKLNFSVTIVSRNKSKLENTLRYENLTQEIIEKNTLIVNATPQGMFPDIKNMPQIPYKYLNNKHILYDLVYNPPLSKFLEEGKKHNATIINGQKMLEFQAEKAWELFNL
ncbi:MAG: shikimate dehydrogenase [Bacteroidales bacterium]|nr:shikimate dehydrogenase [Bacteroidales bacterium]MBN2758007.1 shikimate dehydrogenase [Bacteroidales bacterium]